MYTSDLAGQTPCYTTTPLNLATSTTLNINRRDVATSISISFNSEPTTLIKRESLPTVKVISTHLFTLKYNLATAQKSALSTGAKVGIAIGTVIGGLLILGLLSFFLARMMRRRRERRAAAAGAAFAANSGITSPMTAYSTYAASIFNGQTGMNGQYAGSLPPDRTRSPIADLRRLSSPLPPAAAPATSTAPTELSSTTDPATPPPLSPPSVVKAGSSNREDSLERHPMYSPTGGNFK